MPKKEVPVNSLKNYLPDGTFEPVHHFLQYYKVHLTVSKERKSLLGDYRHSTFHKNHRISVNGNLNSFAFLVTLLHELAHLLTFDQYGNKVAAHGAEWKKIYSQLLHQFLKNKIFPSDIEYELQQSLKNPAASSCAEAGLLRVLRKYDTQKNHHKLIEELKPDTIFRISDGRVFKKGEKLRKRFKCEEVNSGKVYLFSPVYEVEEVSSQ
jgi:predicted SprT family Zn-dependent metalloprotease